MPVILFGEGYGSKIQNGGNYRSDVSFILFDVYLPGSNLWLKRDAIEDIAKTFGIDVVPIVLTGILEEGVDFIKTFPKSTIGKANMEGIVGKPKVDVLDRIFKPTTSPLSLTFNSILTSLSLTPERLYLELSRFHCLTIGSAICF